MNVRELLVKMLKQLLDDTYVMQSQGAGHYTCIPLARRYNKLLTQAHDLFPEKSALIDTFDELDEADPKDPADKMKAIQGIRVEINQLMTLLQADYDEVDAAKADSQGADDSGGENG